ncbi:hypothetical protein GCM10027567_15860 [Spongiibacter taiwanensis]
MYMWLGTVPFCRSLTVREGATVGGTSVRGALRYWYRYGIECGAFVCGLFAALRDQLGTSCIDFVVP